MLKKCNTRFLAGSIAALVVMCFTAHGAYAAKYWKHSDKNGPNKGGRFMKGKNGAQYYLIRKPTPNEVPTLNNPRGRGFVLVRDNRAPINPNGFKKYVRTSRVRINQLKGRRTITARRDHLSRGAIALETATQEIGVLDSSSNYSTKLRSMDMQVIKTENIKSMKIEQRHRTIDSSKVVAEIGPDGYQIGETTIAKGTKLTMFKLTNPSKDAEITIAPVVIDAATGHRRVLRDQATTIKLPYKPTWKGAGNQ